MLFYANKSRFHMPHWCGLAELPYAGAGRLPELHLDIAQWVERQPVTLTATGSNPVIRLISDQD